MKRTTIFADEALLDEIKALASEQGQSLAQVMREALTEHIARKRKAPRTPSFVGAGASGKSNIAERHEQLLWRRPQK